MPTLLALVLAALLPLAPIKIATSSPEAFTDSAVPLLKAELDRRGAIATVKAARPLAIIVAGGGSELRVSLERLWSLCTRDQAQCQAATESYLSQAGEQLAVSVKGEPPPDAKQLRLVVRDGKYVEAMKKTQPDLLARPLAGTWWLIPLLDYPTAARMVAPRDLEALHLTAARAEAAALANVKRELGSVDKLVRALPDNGIGFLTPQAYYNSGLLASAADWEAVAKKMKGKLLVSVPSDDMVLYLDGAQPQAAEVIFAFTKKMFEEAQRPVSKQIVQWSPAGWKPFTPPAQ